MKQANEQTEASVDQVHGVIPPAVAAAVPAVAATSGATAVSVSRCNGLGHHGLSGDDLLGGAGTTGAAGGHVGAAERHIALAQSLRGRGRVARRRVEVADRTGLRHDQAKPRCHALKPLVREPAGDLRAQCRVLATQLVRDPGRLARTRVEAEREDVQPDDADQERPEEADPKPAAREPEHEARIGDSAHGDGAAADGHGHQAGAGDRHGAWLAPRRGLRGPAGAGRAGRRARAPARGAVFLAVAVAAIAMFSSASSRGLPAPGASRLRAGARTASADSPPLGLIGGPRRGASGAPPRARARTGRPAALAGRCTRGRARPGSAYAAVLERVEADRADLPPSGRSPGGGQAASSESSSPLTAIRSAWKRFAGCPRPNR